MEAIMELRSQKVRELAPEMDRRGAFQTADHH